MRLADNIEKLITDSRVLDVNSSAEMDRRTLDDASKAQEEVRRAKSASTRPNIGRAIMKSRITQLASAAAVVVAAGLLISLFNRSATPAYAVEQTVKAMKEIKTVYMAAEFYRQGKFECWMKFAGDPDKPTHMWLGRTGHNLCKICSPQGVFGLNKRTNAVHFARRDERGKDWVIKFGSFFKDAVKKADSTASVEIYTEKDSKTEGEVIVVRIKSKNREQRFLVDPETKLPISFATIRDDAPMEMMRKTLALKNVERIHYNQEPPEGIFDMPADAKIVEEEVDCMVDPDSGLVADGMTHEEACLAIVKQAGQAIVDLDIPKLTSLALFFRLYTPEIWEQVKAMKAAGQWVDEFIVRGDPYQEGDLWYVPCEVKSKDGRAEVSTPMIKFYEMEGHTHCFIIGSREKGIVD